MAPVRPISVGGFDARQFVTFSNRGSLATLYATLVCAPSPKGKELLISFLNAALRRIFFWIRGCIMERNYHSTTSILFDPDELDLRTAFHEAGHAAAIHIGNHQKKLPPVNFEIQVKMPDKGNGYFVAKVVDGNLIQNLPIAVVESFSVVSGGDRHSCQLAYEADVVNLLSGPLAEAKYVSIRDDEVFDLKNITLGDLHNNGGFSDLEKAQVYLECFIASKALREEKMLELLSQAFHFIDNRRHWRCILNLAHYILDSRQETISCDDAIAVLDRCMYSLAHGSRRFVSS